VIKTSVFPGIITARNERIDENGKNQEKEIRKQNSIKSLETFMINDYDRRKMLL
jgi:hypothetical protein